MVIYKVLTNIFRHFKYGDIILPVNSGNQYAKEHALPGDDCLSVDIIKNNPEYFEEVCLINEDELFDKFIKEFVNQLIKKFYETNP